MEPVFTISLTTFLKFYGAAIAVTLAIALVATVVIMMRFPRSPHARSCKSSCTRKGGVFKITSYMLWKYKYWIAIAILSFICVGWLAQTNYLAGQFDQKQADAVANAIKPYEKATAEALIKANKASADYAKLKSEPRVKIETVMREVQ